MITIIYKDNEYSIPSNWLDVSIGQFQEMIKIDTELDDITKTVEILSLLSGIPSDELLELPYTEYKKMVDAISFISSDIPDKLFHSFEYDDTKYVFQCDLENMSTAEYIDLDGLSKTKDPENLHLLMGIMYRPENTKYNHKEVRKRAAIFQQHMPICCAVAAQVFLDVLGQMLLSHSQDSLVTDNK